MPRRKKNTSSDLLCVCQQPYIEGEFMIECSFCTDWYHPTCVGLTAEELQHYKKEGVDWFCKECQDILLKNPRLSNKSIERLRGHVAPKDGWTKNVLLETFPEDKFSSIFVSNRNQREGYKFCHDGKIKTTHSNRLSPYIWFQAKVEAAMKAMDYVVTICLHEESHALKWCNCSCPAGANGECKHTVAVLYHIQHCVLSSCTEFPDQPACTDKLQSWNAKKCHEDTLVLFEDLRIQKTERVKQKKELGSNLRNYSTNLDVSRCVNQETLRQLAKDLHFSDFPVLQVWKSRDYTPVMRKEIPSTSLVEILFEEVEKSDFNFNYQELYEDALENNKTFFDNMISVSIQDALHIAVKTAQQSQSPYWKNKRLYRITASTFKKFIHMRESTDAAKTHNHLNTYNFTSASTEHGKKYETTAIKLFLECPEISAMVQDSSQVGLVVNPKLPYLGASPDYLIAVRNGEDIDLALLEVKCPFFLYMSNMKINEAIGKEKDFYLMKDKDSSTIYLNPTHSVNYQVQGQLNLCNISSCYVIIFVPPKDLVYIKVEKDAQFFNSKILPKLSDIWFEKLLPEFVKEI